MALRSFVTITALMIGFETESAVWFFWEEVGIEVDREIYRSKCLSFFRSGSNSTKAHSTSDKYQADPRKNTE